MQSTHTDICFLEKKRTSYYLLSKQSRHYRNSSTHWIEPGMPTRLQETICEGVSPEARTLLSRSGHGRHGFWMYRNHVLLSEDSDSWSVASPPSDGWCRFGGYDNWLQTLNFTFCFLAFSFSSTPMASLPLSPWCMFRNWDTGKSFTPGKRWFWRQRPRTLFYQLLFHFCLPPSSLMLSRQQPYPSNANLNPIWGTQFYKGVG